ncbi:MAG TPA: hypothetical protein VLR49_07430 [Ferruginibacter sp.]|nr:hypothetical protein [Ferruginibacter sp.]
MEAGDQAFSNFLNGRIIYKRGKIPEPKIIEKEKGDESKIEEEMIYFNMAALFNLNSLKVILKLYHPFNIHA